jgi:PhnB protein
MQVQPYLCFEGRCEEALEFYKKAIGAKVEAMMRFKDAPPEAMQPPKDGSGAQQQGCGNFDPNKIMHSCFRVGDTAIMASDGNASGKPAFNGIALSLTVPDQAAADRTFKALADGGQVQVPLSKTFFAPSFGMVGDRFGVTWMVIVPPKVQ